jgi:oxygen-independent coproporphyrinogen-3 oxidase
MTDGGAGIAIYVHLPWCLRKCHYCDFNSRPGGDAERARYLSALKTEIGRHAKMRGGSRISTIFFGGGTPTVYEGEELAEVLAMIARADLAPPASAGDARAAPPPIAVASPVSSEGPHEPCERSEQGEAGPLARTPEITCEANPETVTVAKLRTMREAGFNRISIGAQSFRESELALLGRGHSPEHTEAAVEAAREAGFEHISLDLIYALPGQTVPDWQRTLLRALALEPEHLSAYGLELAEGTPLHARWEAGEIAPIPDTEHLAMRELTRGLCAEAGLRRYEISNYARPGCECAHNITYWRNEPYIGFGAGAWSYLDGVRSANLREPAAYCAAIEAGESPQEFTERLDPDDALAETLMMGLRMTAGLSLDALGRRFGQERLQSLLAQVVPLAEIGLVEIVDGHLRLTPEGEPLHGEVCVRLA